MSLINILIIIVQDGSIEENHLSFDLDLSFNLTL